jgi:hypothetical protein
MAKLSKDALLSLTVIFSLCCASPSLGEAKRTADERKPAGHHDADEIKATASASGTSSSEKRSSGNDSKSKYPEFSEVLEDATPIEGLIKLYRKDDKLYGEITSATLDKDLIVLISIARGIGETPILGGMTWGFGDDWIWQFRKAGEKIQVVRRNVRFTADKGSPEARAVQLAYTDSVLFSLPIATLSPSGGYVVDLTSVFMSDLPRISSFLRGFTFSRDKSTWASVKGFDDNVEIQVAATYASSGSVEFDTVADSRGVTINVHYSISRLPQTGYEPRLADDRVGYFLTVLKDFSKKSRDDRFVRYINRWDLRKADSSADLSPPKKPIIFWLEKTVPFEHRKPIREGILEWNKAFEKVGLANAIEVRQQPDDAEWDPEDINYNTFRWITSCAGFAMGPSRVNPTTGEILDADIIFDADFLEAWKLQYDVMTPERQAAKIATIAGPLSPDAGPGHAGCVQPWFRHRRSHDCKYTQGMARQMAFGSLVLAEADQGKAKAEVKQFIRQGIKEVVMHEVGHTLGLRHNFKGSTFLTLEEINDPNKTRQTGMAASVMDYLPANFVPKDQKQGDYFSPTLGPYDYWAIKYGYQPLSGGTEGEVPQLKKIASRGAQPGLDYATDEDTRYDNPDPLSNLFDLGKDPLQYARRQVKLIDQLWPDLVQRMVDEGEGYQRARRAFNVLLRYHGDAMSFAGGFIGGIYVHRDHKGDPDARPPFVIVEAKRQEEAFSFLEEEVFGPESYQFPPDLYNHLADSKWSHWGVEPSERSDYPVHDVILAWQDRVLGQLLSSTTLSRLRDYELKVPAEKDAFAAADLMEGLPAAIFSETEKLRDGKYTNRKPAIRSLRRNLQRRYLERLSNLAMGSTSAPEDCQTVAYAELASLEARIKEVLARKAQLDTYTRAHLEESASRIRKVLDARLELASP